MFPKTFRASYTVERRRKIVPVERTGVYENARLPIFVRRTVSADRRPNLICLTATARTMSDEYVGLGIESFTYTVLPPYTHYRYIQ